MVTVTFTATDPDGTIASISVNWGDSTTPDTLSGSATFDTHTYATTGSFTITVTATDNSGSTGSATKTETVTSVTTTPVDLTFMALAPHSPQLGPGQLQVFVNGQHVTDITPGMTSFVSFGPFDITGFVKAQGQNNVTFLNPQTSQFVLVKNVTITQGTTTLLHVSNVAHVVAGHPITLTFSIPPLLVHSLTASNLSPSTDQLATFTASFTGGTAPFKCLFQFGDEESSSLMSSTGTCSVTHDFDESGSFQARVIIKGSSTSDLVSAKLTVTVAQTETDDD
jgi:PKD repeat protein